MRDLVSHLNFLYQNASGLSTELQVSLVCVVREVWSV